VHSVSSCCLELSASIMHNFRFLLYCSPAPSQSCSPALSLGVPTQSLFLRGPRTLPQCMPNPLPQLQFDMHYHCFLLCMPPQFFIRNNVIKAEQTVIIQKTVPYLFLFQMDQTGQLLDHTQTWQTQQSCCSDRRSHGKPNSLAALIEDHTVTFHHDNTCNNVQVQ